MEFLKNGMSQGKKKCMSRQRCSRAFSGYKFEKASMWRSSGVVAVFFTFWPRAAQNCFLTFILATWTVLEMTVSLFLMNTRGTVSVLLMIALHAFYDFWMALVSVLGCSGLVYVLGYSVTEDLSHLSRYSLTQDPSCSASTVSFLILFITKVLLCSLCSLVKKCYYKQRVSR